MATSSVYLQLAPPDCRRKAERQKRGIIRCHAVDDVGMRLAMVEYLLLSRIETCLTSSVSLRVTVWMCAQKFRGTKTPRSLFIILPYNIRHDRKGQIR
eukprot:scaffold9895_cov156-Amphora_coffeaeformis.AAC.4